MGCNTRDRQEDGGDLRPQSAGQGAPEQVHPDVAGQEPEQHHETRLPQVLRGRHGADGDPELDTAQPDQVFAGDDSVQLLSLSLSRTTTDLFLADRVTVVR